jgi:hypothetical protein
VVTLQWAIILIGLTPLGRITYVRLVPARRSGGAHSRRREAENPSRLRRRAFDGAVISSCAIIGLTHPHGLIRWLPLSVAALVICWELSKPLTAYLQRRASDPTAD